MASKARTKRGKSHSLRQSPAASFQNLSVEDNSSSQASWSSDEERTHLDDEHTHHSPSLSWTSGDIDTEGITGTEFQNETGEAGFQSEAVGADYGNGTGGTDFEHETGEQDNTGDTGGAVNNERGDLAEPTLLEAQFEMLTEEAEEPPLNITKLVDTISNLPPSTPPPTTPMLTAPPTPPPAPTDISPSPHVSPPPSPILQTSPKLSRNSPSPVPVLATSPSPVLILHTSPSPIPVSQTSPSPIPSSRNSPSPVPSPTPELHVAASDGQRKEGGEGEGEREEGGASNPFSPAVDEAIVTEYTPKASRNPFEEDISATGMENSDSELESDPELTLKPASTNPFIQLSEVPSATTDDLNPFRETPTTLFHIPPPPLLPPMMLPSNPFDDDVISNDNDVITDEAGAAASESVPQLVVEREGQGEGSVEWSETSSTAEDTLPSLEETHCISLSVFQQGKDSPSNLSAQYDKLSDLSSLLDKGSSGRSSQLDKLSEEGEEFSRPESQEKSDMETVSSFPSSMDLSLMLEAEPIDDNLHPQENYFENEVCSI